MFIVDQPRHCAARLVAAIVVAAVSADVGRSEQIDGDQLLESDRVVEIRIQMSPDDWSALCRQTRNAATAFSGLPSESPYTYFKADLSIDGVEIKSVGVRKKGFFGSADGQRPSLKVKFDEYKKQDPVKGLGRLTLNNNKQDRSQTSQSLTYELFRKAGNVAPRSGLAHVIVNGESLGVYSNVESIKKPFLKRAFGDSSGNLYEGTLTDFHPGAISNIEVKTNSGENDLADVKRLAKLLAVEGDLDLDELEAMVNLDSFFRHWALESLIGYWDGYSANQNNYFVYFNPADGGRGHFIPWGADWAFTNGGPFNFGNREATVIYAQGILANCLYHTPDGPERYRATMTHILNEVWDEEEMLAEIDRIEELVVPHLHATQSETRQAMDEVRSFIRNRRATLDQALKQWEPNVPPEPRTPAHAVDVGKMTGSFSTELTAGPPAGPSAPAGQRGDGKADINLELEGKTVEFDRVTVVAQEFRIPAFGGFGGPPGAGPGGRRPGPPVPASPPPPAPINLRFTGTRAGEQPISISLIIDRGDFEKALKAPVRVSGSFREGGGGGPGGGFGFGGFGGGPNRSVVGELLLTKAGIETGDEIVGTFDLRVVETRGGMFQQRRPPGPPQRRSGPPQQSSAITLQQAFDVDRDGKISPAEIGNASEVLKRFDRNDDGTLSGAELQRSFGSPETGPPPSRRRRPEPNDDVRVDAPRTQPVANGAAESTDDPVVLTTDEDHKNMLTQLGITKLRPGPSGNPEASNAANYDEESANPFPKLPELLTLTSGEKVFSADQWRKHRRPEIVEAFEREVLGRVPKHVPKVTWELKETRDGKAGDIETVEQHIIGVVDNSACPEIEVRISMSLTLPKATEEPVPVLMMFGWTPFDPLPPWMRGRSRQGSTSESQLIAAGWGVAKLNPSSVQDDSGGFRSFGRNQNQPKRVAGLTRGIIGLCNLGQPRKPDDWGALRAWAWGASRGLDYLQSRPEVDKGRVGIEGVSRYGKAALVTLAFDERFAMGLIGSSGEGGASLYRRNFGEAVENLTGSGEYHWMAGNFLKYGAGEATFGSKNANDLPVDAHQLIALCAPRLTFISYGVPEKGDALWLDQQGSFMATVAAQPAFRLLGAKTLGRSDDYTTEKMPPVNEGLIDGDLAWRQHDGGHTDAPNIPHFIRWANARFDANFAARNR